MTERILDKVNIDVVNGPRQVTRSPPARHAAVGNCAPTHQLGRRVMSS